MILLRRDCLVFKTANGEHIPCSAQDVTVELMGDSTEFLDPELVRNAAEAVLYYFKTELGRTTVSVAEFSEALEKVLHGLGLDVKSAAPAPPSRILESDLSRLAGEKGESCELLFFPQLRNELRQQLERSPQIVHFRGLRACAQRLTGARRWSGRCQTVRDHIVEYLRSCLSAEQRPHTCALIVS